MDLPARIGKYELVEFLGGGMSHVYRAKDMVLKRTVALKIMTPAACADQEAKTRFLQEARMAGNIVHDNIISIFDFGEEQGRPYIVMEFLRGESLHDVIKNGRTGDLKNQLRIALQIARALEYVHSRRIVHRDVKPENMHIDSDGKVKLMDFGIAKSEGGLSQTRVGFALGTPHYMSPEQILGQPVTPAVDIWSFGILLFEMFCGVRPVQGETFERIFHQVLYEPLNLAPLAEAGLPKALVRLIEQCTAKNPLDRIQSFTLIARELEQLLSALAATAPSEASIEYSPRSPGRSAPDLEPPRRRGVVRTLVDFLLRRRPQPTGYSTGDYDPAPAEIKSPQVPGKKIEVPLQNEPPPPPIVPKPQWLRRSKEVSPTLPPRAPESDPPSLKSTSPSPSQEPSFTGLFGGPVAPPPAAPPATAVEMEQPDQAHVPSFTQMFRTRPAVSQEQDAAVLQPGDRSSQSGSSRAYFVWVRRKLLEGLATRQPHQKSR